jgi:hypothetical protein
MSELTQREWDACVETAQFSGRMYSGIDTDEVLGQIGEWIAAHWDVVERYRTEPKGFGKFKVAIRRAANKACEDEILGARGTDMEGHYTYSRAELKRILSQALDAAWHIPPGRGYQESTGSTSDPSGTNDWWDGLIDVRAAFSRLTVSGQATLRLAVMLDFDYDGGGRGKGGKATLSVDGNQVAEGRTEKTQPNIFSADETADVGLDNQTPVAQGIGYGPEETKFTGKIHKVVIEVE